ncbi:calcium:proton antiporter activity protein, partial [Coemansia erecta]
MSHTNIKRSLSHRLPNQQKRQQQSQNQRFAKSSTFSPSSTSILDWEYQAMIEMHRPVTNVASDNDNDTETVSCSQSNSPCSGRNSNIDSHTSRLADQPRPVTALHHHISVSESTSSSKVKSHSHDGTLTRQSSQQQSLLQQQQQQVSQHVPSDSPDLLNSRQLRRQFARYSNNVSPNFDEEQMVAFNGPGHSNLNHENSMINENGDVVRLSDDSTSCEDNEGTLTVAESLKNAAKASWLNVLIVFVPLGYIAHFLRWPVVSVFVLNYLAIIPLSALMGFATEEVSIRFGPTWGGVINAAFGNAVELIVAVIALIEEEYRIVQAGLIGSVLSNTLLVLGCAFVAGGLRHRVQLFHAEAAQCAGALLALSVLSMIIPAAYHGVHASGGEITNGILIMSRGTALILLIVYILFLIFQLKTHSDIFDGTHTQTNAPAAILSCCSQSSNSDSNHNHGSYSRSSSDHGFQPCAANECYNLGKSNIVAETQQNNGLETDGNLGLN